MLKLSLITDGRSVSLFNAEWLEVKIIGLEADPGSVGSNSRTTTEQNRCIVGNQIFVMVNHTQ